MPNLAAAKNWASIAATCSGKCTCTGFNTNGQLKQAAASLSISLSVPAAFATAAPCVGFYVRSTFPSSCASALAQLG